MIDAHAESRHSLVGALRHSPVVTVEESESLWDAWQLMFVSGLRYLVVVDALGACSGMLTDRAVLMDLPLTEEHLSGRRVSDLMSSPGVVHAKDSAYDAASRMTHHSVEALPVIDDQGRLVGLVTAADLTAWLAAS